MPKRQIERLYRFPDGQPRNTLQLGVRIHALLKPVGRDLRIQVMHVMDPLAAMRAKVEVGAHLAVEALAPQDVLVARVARVDVGGCLGVVQMIPARRKK